jgi:threonylcarbamoyladenosine tRNA methylthiotransferase MtaB
MSRGRTFTIRTLGCKANQYDSQLLREDLLRRGFVECRGEGDADVCIVNTCTVTAQSDAKSRQAIRALKRENPASRVVVTGCYAHTNPGALREMPDVDEVFDNPSKAILGDRVCAGLNVAGAFAGAPCSRITFFSGHTRAFVKIQDGCDKKCSYCIVRVARGRSRSRPIRDILGEVEGLVSNGYREVVLTGIHIGSLGVDAGGRRSQLPLLIENLGKIEGLIRIRLSSLEPKELTDELIEAIRTSAGMCRHLHIPLQSGSDAVLHAMNRDYTRESYLRTVRTLRDALPGISISTDVMVGFPGETEEDFQQTREVVSQAEFSKVHVFRFSSRPGTPAAGFPDQVSPSLIRERLARLSEDAKAAALTSRRAFQGRVVEVLAERKFRLDGKRRLPTLLQDGRAVYEGFSSNYLRTVFGSDEQNIEHLRNQLQRIRVEGFDERYLYGRKA